MLKSLLFKISATIVGSSLLLFSFQNCNSTKFGEAQGTLEVSSVAACDPSTARSCEITNGIGAEFCDASGISLGCNVIGCNPGFLINGNFCVPNTCSPDSQTPCVVANGAGVQICNAAGTQYGQCQVNSCNPGYVLQGNQCVSVVCSIPSSQPCAIANGSGSQVCMPGNGGRNAWDACVAQSCNPGYIMQNGSCMPGVCMPNAVTSCTVGVGTGNQTCTAQSVWGTCVINACTGNYHLDNGVCVANACMPGSIANCQFGNGSGTYICNAQGSGYGACTLTSCNPGFNLQNGVCVANACAPSSQTGCSEGNGTGLKTCNPQGTGYGSCVLNACNPGYNLQNGVCVANACSPGSSTACQDANGSGMKTCNAQGTAYGSCVLNACNPGFNFEILAPNNRCVAQTCSPNSTQPCSQDHGSGLSTCNPQGTGYGSCVLNACEANYSLIGGVCVLNVCAPNSSASCSADNGTGTKICNAQGTAYGSCVLNACNQGFYSEGVSPNMSCLAQTCSPNSSASCSENNGTGNKTCNAAGSAYGSCVLNACNQGFYSQGAVPNMTCVAQVCSPNSSTSCPILYGTGSKTCNAVGSGYGACGLVSCNNGYNAQNGACVANVCSPNTSTSCSANNGTGTKTCNSSGTAYGSCVLNACNQGYYSQGSVPNLSCVAQVCSPNSQTSCSANNGTGTKTCNSLGSAYGSCVLSACNQGYYSQGAVPNLTCAAQTCTPNSSTSCPIANGAGSKTCNTQGSGYGSCSLVSCNAGYYASNGSCVAYGTWIKSPAPACSKACGQAAVDKYGTVSCSTSTCDPNADNDPLVNHCAATEACPAISWISMSSTCSGATPIDTHLYTNKTGMGGSIGSENSSQDHKLCTNFQMAWGVNPPDTTGAWIDAGLRDDSDNIHSLSENSNSGSLQAMWIKSSGIGTARWHRTGTGGCPAGWFDIKIWDDDNGRRDLCEGGAEDHNDNLCFYPMPATCDSVMLCAGATFKVLNYQIPATSAITTAQMDAYCNAHARGGVNDYNANLGDHAGGSTSVSGNAEGAYYGSCFSKSAKSTGSRTTGPNSSSAFTCTCN